MAHPAWNAGFSRHSSPQAGGGTTSFARMARLRVRPLGLAMNRPRPCGPLCRLKPALQAGLLLNPARLHYHSNWRAAHVTTAAAQMLVSPNFAEFVSPEAANLRN